MALLPWVAQQFAARWPKAVAKIVDDIEPLLAFFDFSAEHWIHLKTTNPIESTFATVRSRPVPSTRHRLDLRQLGGRGGT